MSIICRGRYYPNAPHIAKGGVVGRVWPHFTRPGILALRLEWAYLFQDWTPWHHTVPGRNGGVVWQYGPDANSIYADWGIYYDHSSSTPWNVNIYVEEQSTGRWWDQWRYFDVSVDPLPIEMLERVEDPPGWLQEYEAGAYLLGGIYADLPPDTCEL
jgi:hypothetical protein